MTESALRDFYSNGYIFHRSGVSCALTDSALREINKDLATSERVTDRVKKASRAV